jgi:hypothetical protein
MKILKPSGQKRHEKEKNRELIIIWVDMVDRNDIPRFIFLKNKIEKEILSQSKGSRYPAADQDCST